MPIDYYEKVWHNGEFIPWKEATVHVASHVISYATCLFEGIRCYETPQGPAIFRLKEHAERLVNSCKIYRMEQNYPLQQIQQAIVELIPLNQQQHTYIRPVVFRGYGEIGFFFFQAEDGIRDGHVTGVQTCALAIFSGPLLQGVLEQGSGDRVKRRGLVVARIRSEERRVGKSVDLGGRRIIKKK